MSNTAASIITIFIMLCDLCEHAEKSPNYCPRNTTLVGNSCLFILKPYTNFTQTLKLCRTKIASLLSLSSVNNFKDVCKYVRENIPPGFAFLGADQDPGNTAQYIWHHDKSRVNFPREYWMDEVPQHLKCIEIISFGNYCRINDIVCWKASVPVCEFRNQNPCLVNNGGCEDTCVPREFRTRTCKCVSGKKVHETRCVDQSESDKLSKFYCTGSYSFEKNFTRGGDCWTIYQIPVYRNDVHRVFSGTSRNVLTLSPETILNVCNVIRRFYDEHIFWLGTEYSSSKTNIIWEYDGAIHNLSDYKKVIEVDEEHLGKDGFHYVIKLSRPGKCILAQSSYWNKHDIFFQKPTLKHQCLENNGGCLEKKCVPTNITTFDCMCNDEIYKDINGTCVDIDECLIDNGGCHHLCHNTVGGFHCSCRDGYSLDEMYHTECNIECIHRNECKEYVVTDGFKCGCLPGYELIKDNICKKSINDSHPPIDIDGDDTNVGFSIFNLFWIFVTILFCSIILITIRRKTRVRRLRQDARRRNEVVTKPLAILLPDRVDSKVSVYSESHGTTVDPIMYESRLNTVAETESIVTAIGKGLNKTVGDKTSHGTPVDVASITTNNVKPE